MLGSILNSVPADDLPEVAYHVIRCLSFGLSASTAAAAAPVNPVLSVPAASLRVLAAIERQEGHPLHELPEPVRHRWIDRLHDLLAESASAGDLVPETTASVLHALRTSEPLPLFVVAPSPGAVEHAHDELADQEITIITKTFNEQFQVLLGNAEVAVQQLQDHLRSVQQAVSSLGTQLHHVTRPGASLEGHQPVSGQHAVQAQKTILVLEDSAEVHKLIQGALTPLGYALLTASTAEEAMRQFKDKPAIDLFIADVQMPGLTGPQVAAILRRTRPDLSVLYISGGHELTVRSNAGGDPYLLKPFSIGALTTKVRDALHGGNGPQKADAGHG